jgi:hypothetical protein
VRPGSQSAQLQLTQILLVGTHRWAIINGRLVKPGDRVNGFRVGHIGAWQVRVQQQGHWQTLRLFPPIPGEKLIFSGGMQTPYR